MPGRSSVIAPPASMSSSRKRGVPGSRSTPRIASTARPATSRTPCRTSTGWCPKAGEAPITRTCRLILAATAAALPSVPAAAVVGDRTALTAYIHARAAETAAPLDDAAAAYAAALTLTPDNEVLAQRAMRTGLWAGDEALALRAAAILDRAGTINPEGRLLLAAEAVKAKRWPAAAAQADLIGKDEVFGFMAPVWRAWIAEGSGKGDPAAILAAGSGERSPLAAYAAEQRALLLIARGDKGPALAAVQPVFARADNRSDRVRLLLASQLAGRGWRAEAAELLQGDSAPVADARARLAAGRPLPGPAPGAPAGIADFLVALAADLSSQ